MLNIRQSAIKKQEKSIQILNMTSLLIFLLNSHIWNRNSSHKQTKTASVKEQTTEKAISFRVNTIQNPVISKCYSA